MENGRPVEEWIERRPARAPASVWMRVRRLVADGDPGTGDVWDRLAAAALEGLRDVASGPGDRASAADLLATDALLTYAIEAAAEAGPQALRRLLDDLDVGRFEILHSTVRGER